MHRFIRLIPKLTPSYIHIDLECLHKARPDVGVEQLGVRTSIASSKCKRGSSTTPAKPSFPCSSADEAAKLHASHLLQAEDVLDGWFQQGLGALTYLVTRFRVSCIKNFNTHAIPRRE